MKFQDEVTGNTSFPFIAAFLLDDNGSQRYFSKLISSTINEN